MATVTAEICIAFKKSVNLETVVAKSLDTFTNIVLAEVSSRPPCPPSLQRTSLLFSPPAPGLNEEHSVAMELRWDLSGWQFLLAPDGHNRVSPEAWTGQLVLYDLATRLCHVRGHIHTSRAQHFPLIIVLTLSMSLSLPWSCVVYFLISVHCSCPVCPLSLSSNGVDTM